MMLGPGPKGPGPVCFQGPAVGPICASGALLMPGCITVIAWGSGPLAWLPAAALEALRRAPRVAVRTGDNVAFPHQSRSIRLTVGVQAHGFGVVSLL